MAGSLIGALRISLSAETSAFEAGMKRSQRTAKQTASSIVSDFKSAGGAMGALKAGVAGFVASLSVGTILAAGKAALDYAASLGETAAQLNVTTRELQNFRAAAAENGASLDEADAALGKLSLNMSKAISGSKQSAAAFASVGVSIQDMTTKSRWEIIGQIADKMIEQGGAAKNAAAGTAIFGRGFQKIIPTLNQGSAGLNSLAEANERLGGVLSDKEIQNADKTADKIDQLNRVLKTKLASDVAANSDAIAEFTTFLFDLVNAATQARQALADFTANYNLFNLGTGKAYGFGYKGRSVTTKLGEGGSADAAARRMGLKLMSDVPRKGTPPQFLASGGGGGRRGGGGRDRSAEEAERKRLEALRDANQFDQEIRRAKIDVLNSEKQLAADYIERRNISIQILEAERAAFDADLRYQVAAGELSQVQADQLTAERTKLDALEVSALNAEEEAERREEVARYEQQDFEHAREKLEMQASLATTAAEQRDLALQILDLDYRYQRARLQTIMAEEKIGSTKWEQARRDLAQLNATQGLARQNVINGTAGPIEEYLKSIPNDAREAREALEDLAVRGVQKLEDSLVDVLMGTKSLKEAFHDMAEQILEDLLRMAIRQFILGPIMQAIGGAGGGGFADGGIVGGFASGGFVSGPGGPRADKIPAMLSNGEFVVNAKATKSFLPLLKAINDGAGGYAIGGLVTPRAAMGERVRLANDNQSFGRGQIVMHNDFRGADPSAVASIKAHLDQLEARLPGQIVSTVQDAKSRFIIR